MFRKRKKTATERIAEAVGEILDNNHRTRDLGLAAGDMAFDEHHFVVRFRRKPIIVDSTCTDLPRPSNGIGLDDLFDMHDRGE